MGLFDKIAKNILKQAFGSSGGQTNFYTPQKINNDPDYNTDDRYASAKSSSAETEYGDVIPSEENQYNFDGDYVAYFNKVFTDEYPEYDIRYERLDNRAATVFTFFLYDETKLIVEIMSCTSSSKKLRRECEENGTPYLRFYHNKIGWWNRRSYVTNRVSAALGY